MKKLTLIASVGVVLVTTGCADIGHDNHAERGDHTGGHQSMMNNHHEGMMEANGHEQMQSKHEEMMSGHDHEQMMKNSETGGHAHGSEGSLAGKPGKENSVSQTIPVIANDTMRFLHDPLNIKNGETIKFVVTNKGAIPHEFAIGTKDELMEHGQMMQSNPNMHHAPGGNVITIKPGETKALIWEFENAWEIEVACNIPGHYQAGMHSPVTVNE